MCASCILKISFHNFADGERSEEAIRLGNKCLVYISCCLSGRGYPNGDIEESKCATVRSRVFQFLCSQHTINADESEETYPYLRLFLDFNTKEFLNALSMAFQDSYLSVQLLQRLVDILISITLHENSSKVCSCISLIFACVYRNAHEAENQNSKLRNSLITHHEFISLNFYLIFYETSLSSSFWKLNTNYFISS